MKVVICGAGIAGLALANRIAAIGGDVVVLERSPGPRPQGYMIDFFGVGYDAIRAMGLEPELRAVAYHVPEARYVDEQGRRRAGLQLPDLATGPLVGVMRPDLERVLRESLPPQIDLRFGVSPVAVTERHDSIGVTLGDGTGIDADLLVGADGIHSTIRRLVFGAESRFFRPLGFHTAAFCFDAPQIHDALRDRAYMTDTVGRQMGFYALRDGRVAAFSVHRTPERTVPADVRTAMRDVYGDLGWLVPTALDRCPPSAEIYYDVVGQIVMPSWSSERVVLVGDACSAVSLLAGQGASLGIAGAYVLADQLARTQPIGTALVRYEQNWRPVAEEKQRAGRAAARWYLPRTELDRRIRRAGLRVARLPVVSRTVAGLLTGKTDDLITGLG